MSFSNTRCYCCHDGFPFAMMSDEKAGLFENDYKSCFARSMVVNSQHKQQNKPQELFFGKQPLNMTVEHGSEINGGTVMPSGQGISQDTQGFHSAERSCINSNVSSFYSYLLNIEFTRNSNYLKFLNA